MGPFAGGRFDVDPTPVLLNDPVTDRQSQPGPGADRFGREEWFEDLVTDRRVDPGSGVEDMELDPVQGGAGADGHLSALGAGVEGVGQEVEHDLVDLSRVTR